MTFLLDKQNRFPYFKANKSNSYQSITIAVTANYLQINKIGWKPANKRFVRVNEIRNRKSNIPFRFTAKKETFQSLR